MFGIENIAEKIKKIPNDATAAIAILIYPEYKHKIFSLKDIINKAFIPDEFMDGIDEDDIEGFINKDRYVFVNLLTQQYEEYIGEITFETLMMFNDLECQSLNYLDALIEMFRTYAPYFQNLLDELHELIIEKEKGERLDVYSDSESDD